MEGGGERERRMGKGGIMDEILYRARGGEIETKRILTRLPAQTSQLQTACHVTRVDVFGFRETKASSQSDVIQSGHLSI